MLLTPALLGAGGEPLRAPGITSQQWLNSEPISSQALRGKVVLVEFWTFGCRNCKNVEPHIQQWHRRYKDAGLVVIGVHTPEFVYERNPDNLRDYVAEHEILYPVAVDNDARVWQAFHNWAWPSIYLIGKQGKIRYRRIGEGGYQETERTIRILLDE